MGTHQPKASAFADLVVRSRVEAMQGRSARKRGDRFRQGRSPYKLDNPQSERRSQFWKEEKGRSAKKVDRLGKGRSAILKGDRKMGWAIALNPAAQKQQIPYH